MSTSFSIATDFFTIVPPGQYIIYRLCNFHNEYKFLHGNGFLYYCALWAVHYMCNFHNKFLHGNGFLYVGSTLFIDCVIFTMYKFLHGNGFLYYYDSRAVFIFGLSKERPILDHHAKAHILDFMKSGGFHP